MSQYDKFANLNQDALASKSKALDESWNAECKRAAQAGTFPNGVRLQLFNPPSVGHIEKWSDEKYEAYVHYFGGLRGEPQHYEDDIPEYWNVHLRVRTTESAPLPQPVGPLTRSVRSMFGWSSPPAQEQ